MSSIFDSGPASGGAAGGQNPLEFLINKEDPHEKISFRWGEVVSTDPLQVTLDGDSGPLLSTPIDLGGGGRVVGSRVYCKIYKQRVTILGPSTGTGTENTFIGAAIGTIQVWPGAAETIPTGWLRCDGSAVSRTEYATLFSIIGTTYGVGDGSTTFNLPNFKGRVPTGLDSSQTEFDALGETGGAKTHTHALTNAYAFLRAASSTAIYQKAAGTVSSWNSDYGYNISSIRSPGESTTTATALGGTTDSSSSLQPYLVIHFIIKAQMLAGEVDGLDTTVNNLTVNSNLNVTGTITGVHRAQELGEDVDLDTVLEPGDYVQSQNAQASTALNYPEAQAGHLRVDGLGTANQMVWQTYSIYGPSSSGVAGSGPNAVYRRSYYGSTTNTWSAWKAIYSRGTTSISWSSGWGQLVSGGVTYQLPQLVRDGNRVRMIGGSVSRTGSTLTAPASVVLGTLPSSSWYPQYQARGPAQQANTGTHAMVTVDNGGQISYVRWGTQRDWNTGDYLVWSDLTWVVA